MSHTKHGTPNVDEAGADGGFGAAGGVSNTAYPEAHGFDETAAAEAGGYGTRWQEEAAAANAEVDREQGLER